MNRKAFLACVLMCVILTGCETAKKISEVIKNPDIQVGSLKEQPSEITVTLLTEPDTNTNAEGESAAVDVQLVYMTDDSKLQAADYDQIASTPLPDVLGMWGSDQFWADLVQPGRTSKPCVARGVVI